MGGTLRADEHHEAEHLTDRLRKSGIQCEFCFIPDDGYRPLTDGNRITCVERGKPPNANPATSGITFWIRTGGDFALIATWNHVVYRIPAPTHIPDLAIDLFRGGYLPMGICPHSIPSVLVQTYGLVPCDAVQAWPRNDAAQLWGSDHQYAPDLLRLMRRFSRNEVETKLGQWRTACPMSDGLIRFQFGGGTAIMRLPTDGREMNSLTIAVDGLRTTPPPVQRRFLQAIERRLDATLFAVGNGTRWKV